MFDVIVEGQLAVQIDAKQARCGVERDVRPTYLDGWAPAVYFAIPWGERGDLTLDWI